MGELLATRPEERAALATSPDGLRLQQIYERWGYWEINCVPGSESGTQPTCDLYAMAWRWVCPSS
jgi:hypothetical protein